MRIEFIHIFHSESQLVTRNIYIVINKPLLASRPLKRLVLARITSRNLTTKLSSPSSFVANERLTGKRPVTMTDYGKDSVNI